MFMNEGIGREVITAEVLERMRLYRVFRHGEKQAALTVPIDILGKYFTREVTNEGKIIYKGTVTIVR